MTRSHRTARSIRSVGRRRRGASAVEFAIVAPIFFLLLFGMLEFGRLVMVQQALVNASREGARLAVKDGTTKNDVLDTVEQYLAQASIDIKRKHINVSPNPASAAPGSAITVSITVPYEEVSWLPGSIYLRNQQLSAYSVMRRANN